MDNLRLPLDVVDAWRAVKDLLPSRDDQQDAARQFVDHLTEFQGKGEVYTDIAQHVSETWQINIDLICTAACE